MINHHGRKRKNVKTKRWLGGLCSECGASPPGFETQLWHTRQKVETQLSNTRAPVVSPTYQRIARGGIIPPLATFFFSWTDNNQDVIALSLAIAPKVGFALLLEPQLERPLVGINFHSLEMGYRTKWFNKQVQVHVQRAYVLYLLQISAIMIHDPFFLDWEGHRDKIQ